MVIHEVFRTRHEGEKLASADAIEHTCRTGVLRYFVRRVDPRPGRSIWIATLTGPDGETYVIPALDGARVKEIRDGTLISGTEIIPRGIGMKNIKSFDYPQTWWCRQLPERPQSRFMTPAEARAEARRLGEEVGTAINRRPTRRGHYAPDIRDHFDID